MNRHAVLTPAGKVMMSGVRQEGQRLSRTSARIGASVDAIISAPFLVGAAVSVAIASEAGGGTGYVVLLVVLLAATAFLVWRSWRIDLQVARGGVSFQNLFRRYDLAWDDVQNISLIALPWRGGLGGFRAVTFGLRDGGKCRVQVSAYSSSARREALDALRSFSPPQVKFIDDAG
jgi:hypothetical protein